MQRRKHRQLLPARMMIRKCRRAMFRSKVADSSGLDLTGGKFLTGVLIMKKLLEKHVLKSDEKYVGVMLPPSVGGAVVNAALTLMGRVSVNLNYTLTEETVNFCIENAGIRTVLTSRKFLEKRPFDMNAEVICLEDVKPKTTGFMKLTSLLAAFCIPSIILERLHGLTKTQPDDLLTIIYTSGSTGEPKGVMLSHSNVMSNIDAIDGMFHITKTDVLLGVLPFFHSFGFTGTLWLPLALEAKAVYHFNPLDSRQVGKLAGKHGMTILMATPTFLRSYLKRCTPEEFSKLELAVVGAEKMPLDLYEAFKEKFGVSPTEGYGTTELSPVAAVNVPEGRCVGGSLHSTSKLGSVGKALPGIAVKVVNPDTDEDLGLNTEGLLLIKGPNVMQGYLNQPEKTSEVIQDGWYNTGDVAVIDDEGFITLTGRQSRFSKIGGEMVPHVRIEELLTGLVDDPSDEEATVQLTVTAVPDERKGERLIVLHKPMKQTPEELIKKLQEAGLPNLWIPNRDGFMEVEEIPLLGTGKLDLKGIKLQALEKCGLPVA